ncbi:lipopolysaccharide assembly protein LapA domain-containing protein [Spirochaeta dissipatitropha]
MKKVIIGLIVSLCLPMLIMVIQNTSSVQARFLWFSGEVPIILLLVLSIVGGFITGLLVMLYNPREKAPEPPRAYTERTYQN